MNNKVSLNKVSLKNKFMGLLENYSTKLEEIKENLNLICEKFNITAEDFLNDPHTTGHIGFNPLQTAIMMGKYNVVKYLLSKGASLNRVKGNSPLYVAAQSGQRKIFKLLREKGAQLNNSRIVHDMNMQIFKKKYGNTFLRKDPRLKRMNHRSILSFLKGNNKADKMTKFAPHKKKEKVNIHFNNSNNNNDSNWDPHNPWGLNNTTRQNSIARTMTYMTKQNNNNKRVPEQIRTKGRIRQKVFNQNYLTNKIGSFLVKNNSKKSMGGSQFIHIPNFGKRKVRYQKNGRAYVIVNKKKLKL